MVLIRGIRSILLHELSLSGLDFYLSELFNYFFGIWNGF